MTGQQHDLDDLVARFTVGDPVTPDELAVLRAAVVDGVVLRLTVVCTVRHCQHREPLDVPLGDLMRGIDYVCPGCSTPLQSDPAWRPLRSKRSRVRLTKAQGGRLTMRGHPRPLV